jgi:hypothetical protein
MKWRPFQSGVPYTCQDCPAYAELRVEIERLRKERTYYEEMCSMIADKNFTANQEVDRLRAELKAVRNG